MIVKLFDIQNNNLILTEHCYALPFLKKVMDEYPDTHLDVYKYVFYMSCPNPDLNPFFNLPENEKEDIIDSKYLEVVQAQNLQKDMKLIKCEYPIIDNDNHLERAYTNGFFSGDGTYNCSLMKETKCNYKSLSNKSFSRWGSNEGFNVKSILLFITLGKSISESQLKPYTISLYLEYLSKLLANTSIIDK